MPRSQNVSIESGGWRSKSMTCGLVAVSSLIFLFVLFCFCWVINHNFLIFLRRHLLMYIALQTIQHLKGNLPALMIWMPKIAMHLVYAVMLVTGHQVVQCTHEIGWGEGCCACVSHEWCCYGNAVLSFAFTMFVASVSSDFSLALKACHKFDTIINVDNKLTPWWRQQSPPDQWWHCWEQQLSAVQLHLIWLEWASASLLVSLSRTEVALG